MKNPAKPEKQSDCPSSVQQFLRQWQDILATDARHLLPSMLKWFYHLKMKKDIRSYPLQDATKNKGTLYQHGKWISKKEKVKPILILHGLYAHPLIMLHLSKLVQRIHNGPVFDLYVKYDLVNPSNHRILLNQAVDRIEQMAKEHGTGLQGVVTIGHSMGAIEAAYKAFVERDQRISSVISIAGPLKEIECGVGAARVPLQKILKETYNGIQSHPEIPLYQIVGRYDWNASLDSTLIRKIAGSYHIIEDAMHFNILFHKELYSQLRHYVPQA